MKKLNLKKKVISVLTDQEKQSINGGGTTSYTDCTGVLCCSPQPCVSATQGAGATCTLSPGCKPDTSKPIPVNPSFETIT